MSVISDWYKILNQFLMWNSVDFIFSYLGTFAIPIFVLDFGFEWAQN